MSSKLPVTAVFDIGKTNKKFFLFDESLTVVHQTNKIFDEIEDDDGFACDDLKALTGWIFETLEKIISDNHFEIKAVNFSAYGATLVHLGRDGKPVTPLYNYLKPFPPGLAADFYQACGGREVFALETATPPLGMLNSGLQLFWLKKMKPRLFQKIETTLHFPQYLGYLLTGTLASELTSIGCHTGMWNFSNKNYHNWMKKEGLLKLLPDIQPVQTSYAATVGSRQFKAGIGIHDSSAALAPYLMAFDEPFIQLSTGTWSIAMNPFSADALTADELNRDCLHYLNIYGEPVKASRFLLGGEFAYQREKISRYYGTDPQNHECEPDLVMLQKLIQNSDSRKKLILEKTYGHGANQRNKKSEWNPGLFGNEKEAMHQCLLDLAAIQANALNLAEGSTPVQKIIITGGFAKNRLFCKLLASMFPEKDVYTASLPDASALGAALVLKEAFPKNQLKEMAGLKLQRPFDGISFDGYSPNHT